VVSNSRTVVASVALALSGCAVGLFLGRWMLAKPTAERTAASSEPQDLTPLIAEIRRSNELALESLRRNGVGPAERTGDRAGVAPNSEAVERLLAAVEQTNALLLERMRTRGNEIPASFDELKGAGFSSVDALLARSARSRGSLGGPYPYKAAEEVRHLHELWTRDDLFERYGPPSSVGANERGGLGLCYGSSQSDRVVFDTAERLITGVRFP